MGANRKNLSAMSTTCKPIRSIGGKFPGGVSGGNGQILEIWKFSLWAVGSCTSGSDGPDGRFTKKRPQPHFTVCSEDLHRSLS
jgi:hypothetical protein